MKSYHSRIKISSKHSCAHTNSARFGANIEKAMIDVAAVFADN